MWERWRAGEWLQQIFQMFDRHHTWLRGILEVSGDSAA